MLRNTDVMVGHGGFGTTMAALAGGVPQVVIPLFAGDQFVNAEQVAVIGAGVRLDGGPEAVPELPGAITKIVGDAMYKERAGGVAAAMAALPPVASAVSVLEELARG